MSANSFYNSWTLGRDFTAPEWGQYCDEHPDSREVVYEFISTYKWIFNVHGVCLNPQIIDSLDGRFGYEVRIWEQPKDLDKKEGSEWGYSCYINEGTWGGSAGWGSAESKTEAIIKGLQSIANKYQREAYWDVKNEVRKQRCLNMVEKVQREIIRMKEPILFEL